MRRRMPPPPAPWPPVARAREADSPRARGDTYNYEKGQFSTIGFDWKDSTHELTIGARAGSYPGMPPSRTFSIVFVDAKHGIGADVTSTVDETVKYDGSEVKLVAK
jgi:alpha-D-xyloside xylohydrolase